ncbi:hypothetical protein [Candidatus Williamhamiltonella defendens]|nr:hypothetical protein [Candidatus Hamiltonella defensa]
MPKIGNITNNATLDGECTAGNMGLVGQGPTLLPVKRFHTM